MRGGPSHDSARLQLVAVACRVRQPRGVELSRLGERVFDKLASFVDIRGACVFEEGRRGSLLGPLDLVRVCPWRPRNDGGQLRALELKVLVVTLHEVHPRHAHPLRHMHRSLGMVGQDVLFADVGRPESDELVDGDLIGPAPEGVSV